MIGSFTIEELSDSQRKTPLVLPHGNLISQIVKKTLKKTHTQKQHQSGAISVGIPLIKHQTESFGDGLGRLIKCPANPPRHAEAIEGGKKTLELTVDHEG